MTRAVQLRIEGRVQGVGFRDWLRREAVGSGISGWVRNRGDGSVEALAQGPSEQLDQLVAACHRGPALAHVSHVKLDEAAVNLTLSADFVQLSTVS